MLSTLTSYRLYTNDIAKSLARVQSDSTVKRDAAYYEANIGKVKTVDEFLGNQRLYLYALKAYGLSDQAASKGFIRKVIESDLTDSSSFANKLNDARYRDFASAFNFKAASTTPVAQSASQTESLVEAYSEARVRRSTAEAAKTNHFIEKMGTLTSIDELIDDPVLYDVMMRSAGFEPNAIASMSKDYVKGVFRSMGGMAPQAGMLPLYSLGAMFNFQSDGTVPSGQRALSAEATDTLVYNYNTATDNLAGPGSAAHETAYYERMIGRVDDAADVAGDERLFRYTMTAYGFDPTVETPSFIYAILKSDPSDPASTLNTLPASTSAERTRKQLLIGLNAAFDFDSNGYVPSGHTAQSATQITATKDAFYANYKTIAEKKDASEVLTFKMILAKTKSLSDLMAFDPAFGRDALDVALKAFDIEPETADLIQIRKVLQSDASDPNSYVNKLGDERFKNLAAAFNFDSDGKLRAERLVQSTSAQATTGSLYAASFGTSTTQAQKDQIKTETKAYIEGLADIDTLDDFVESGSVLKFALTAYGLGKENISETKLRKILTSDLGDKKSYVYTLNDKRYEKLAAAFNFTPAGTVRTETTGVQTGAAKLSTQNLYLLQKLEEKAGEQNEGTRLALYFMRKSPDLKSTMGLLADKALLEVTKTALSLPDSISQLDVDAQVKVIEKKLKVADLQDKGKLDKFIARFAALYDLKNNSGANAPFMALFTEEDSTTSLLARL